MLIKKSCLNEDFLLDLEQQTVDFLGLLLGYQVNFPKLRTESHASISDYLDFGHLMQVYLPDHLL